MIKQLKSFLNFTLSVLIVFLASFMIALTAVADWTAPDFSPASCPTGVPGCDIPLNTGSDAQTKQGGLNIMGNVGIGTTSPALSLSIERTGMDAVVGIYALGNEPSPYQAYYTSAWVLAQTSNGQGWLFGQDNWVGGNFSILQSQDPWNRFLSITPSGNVGIGTTAPTGKLEIQSSQTAEVKAINLYNRTGNSND
ncbi:MAG: hypothetical protein HYW34_00935, partial [Candidatus Brennerbacteria bacterium]|nr:hypothetical protein [Candidatus Brennerbacteria bacterium]